jgi:hypothetical protein
VEKTPLIKLIGKPDFLTNGFRVMRKRGLEEMTDNG